MDFGFLNTAFELIDLRSFSNLWFWIALAVLWSTAAHWVIGVPFDLINRARAGHAEAAQDVVLLVGVYSRRMIYIAEASGLWITGFVAFGLTALATAGFAYRVEFCQALFLLGLPLTLVGAMSLQTARAIQGLSTDALLQTLRRHRVKVQVVGMISIFVTSLWGMWTNMQINVLG